MRYGVLLCVVLIGCSNRRAGEVEQAVSLDTAEVFIAGERCAVLLFPDSAAAEKMAQELGEEALNEVAADMNYYQYECENDLSEQGVTVMHTDKNRFAFVSGSGTWLVSKDTVRGDLLLWDGRGAPIVSGSAEYHETADTVFGLGE